MVTEVLAQRSGSAISGGTWSVRRWHHSRITIADAQRPYAVSLMNSTTHLDGETAEDGSSLSGG